MTTEYGKLIHGTKVSRAIVIQNEKKKERASQIGDKITPKNRNCLRGVDEKYLQWNKILINIFNAKMKIIQNRTRKSDTKSGSEEGEIGDQDESDSEIKKSHTSERNGY